MPVCIQLIIICLFHFSVEAERYKNVCQGLFSGHAFINKQNKLVRMNGERSATVLQSIFHSLFGFFSYVCVWGGVLYPDDTVNLTPGECKLDNKAFRSLTIKHTQLCCTVSVAVFMQLYGAADT